MRVTHKSVVLDELIRVRRDYLALRKSLADALRATGSELIVSRVYAAYNAHGAMFNDTYCSQCGQSTGPRDSGFSHCDDHRRLGL